MITNKQMEDHHQEGEKMVMKAILERAIEILKTNKKVKGFYLNEGYITFYRYDDTSIESRSKDYTRMMNSLEHFIASWEPVYSIITNSTQDIRKPA